MGEISYDYYGAILLSDYDYVDRETGDLRIFPEGKNKLKGNQFIVYDTLKQDNNIN